MSAGAVAEIEPARDVGKAGLDNVHGSQKAQPKQVTTAIAETPAAPNRKRGRVT